MHVGGRDRSATQVCDELHDELLPLLAVALQDLEEARATGDAETLAHAERTLRSGWDLARGALVGWHPQSEGHELAAAMRTAVAAARAGTSLRVLVHVDEDVETQHRGLVVRAAEELVRNVVLHADASRCHVWVTQSAGRTLLAVFDDGTGFPDPAAVLADDAPGRGLVGLARAAEALDGHLSVGHRPRGTVVRLAVPDDRAPQRARSRVAAA